MTAKPIEVGDSVYCPASFYGKKTVTAVDASADTLTCSTHGFTNGQQAFVRITGGVLPTPLLEDNPYYIVGATTNAFQLAETPGGAALNLSNVGSGFIEVLCLMDPSTVTATVTDPAGAVTSYAYSGTITKAIVGVYYFNFPTTLAGTHKVKYVSTGNPAEPLEYTFTVVA